MEKNTGKNKLSIAILFGGCSTEYEVSLQSAYSGITHLNQEKYNAHLIGITREGTWLRYEGDIDRIPEDGESFTCDTEDLEIRVTGVENHRILEAVVRKKETPEEEKE